MNVNHITDFDIQALIDNELGWEEEKRVREFIENNPHASKRFQELKDQKEILVSWWQQNTQ